MKTPKTTVVLLLLAPFLSKGNIEQTEETWETAKARRLEWWSFQPITDPKPPIPKGGKWSGHPVDRFILKALEDQGLDPSMPADSKTLHRRLSFVLTGLPPTGEASPDKPDALVDELLASPQFGEHWARHWMDWVRYADSHGSEGDPMIPNSEVYRNYLIRALNADIPYDQLLHEHIAGDVLPNPRINKELGLNESTIGTAHYRFVLHGFAPTDAHDEHVRYNDDAIDTLSKAFLGLTISCARCHNHKFDPISQKDYYALFGIVSNGRPAQLPASANSLTKDARINMEQQKETIRDTLAKAWLKAVPDLPAKLQDTRDKSVRNAIDKAAGDMTSALRPWARLRNSRDDFSSGWKQQKAEFKESLNRLHVRSAGSDNTAWFSASTKGYGAWPKAGTGFEKAAAPAGSFSILASGDRILDRILPSGAYTHLYSNKDSGFLTTPRFKFTEGDVWIRAIGNQSTLRYVVWSYPRRGTVYPKGGTKGGNFTWQRWNTKYWAGDSGYMEATTSRDAPVEAGGSERSWFGVTEAMVTAPGQPGPKDETAEVVAPIFSSANPGNTADLAQHYADTLSTVINKWKSGRMTDAEANFLNSFVSIGWLPTSIKHVPSVTEAVQQFRKLEASLPVPKRIPGLVDGKPFNQPLLIRGNHKKPGKPVPRRFLEVIDETPYSTDKPARLQFAGDLLRKDNPLTARVIVNRVWHHVFGQGLVTTTDNFGHLGEQPSHPELLDHLAVKFRREGWSIKHLIKYLVTSKTFRMDSTPSTAAKVRDPDNRLLSHARVRRLPAESIRDAMLAASGRLSLSNPGTGGRDNSNSNRRSVYQQIRRNGLNPLLTVFDAPAPATCTGRRNATNVPAQSLALLNNPFIHGLASSFAQNAEGANDPEKIQYLFKAALGREANSEEVLEVGAYLSGASQQQEEMLRKFQGAEKGLADARKQLAGILDPAREKLLKARSKDDGPRPKLPQPEAHWDFKGGLKDRIEGLTAITKGNARIENGALVVKNGGFAMTAPLPFDVREKTLAAWVQLDNANQRGGGIVTIQNRDGKFFDSIVFGEQTPGKWMSGSNNLKRTQKMGGPSETLATREPVHIAITYAANGTIAAYRNGQPYGRPYKTGLQSYQKGNCVLVFGLRHGISPDSRRGLNGRIIEGSLFTRVLPPDAIAALSGGKSNYISETELLEGLTPAQRDRKSRLELSINALNKQLSELQPATTSKTNSMQDIALAIFNMKEFIYLR